VAAALSPLPERLTRITATTIMSSITPAATPMMVVVPPAALASDLDLATDL
jgi:hypothetical protein